MVCAKSLAALLSWCHLCYRLHTGFSTPITLLGLFPYSRDCAQPTVTHEHLIACVMPHLQCPRDHVTLFRRPPTGLERVS